MFVKIYLNQRKDIRVTGINNDLDMELSFHDTLFTYFGLLYFVNEVTT